MIVIEIGTFTDLGGFPESVAVRIALEADSAVAIPRICPIPPPRNVKPLGRVPDFNFQVTPPLPPRMKFWS